ncbi:hypothetical protein CF651_29415 [Paenibacillus rigui]|uniref:Uncharacterized protein n=1 Tax=Paenibacillus rigui TaxID=554312 RepID=A0A229UHC2_9BACL|nr:hypothetical protein CF651_29415 [Paenibacillus rigui]
MECRGRTSRAAGARAAGARLAESRGRCGFTPANADNPLIDDVVYLNEVMLDASGVVQLSVRLSDENLADYAIAINSYRAEGQHTITNYDSKVAPFLLF